MGNVGFLAFDLRSGHDYQGLTEEQEKNRQLLREAMWSQGFRKLRSEFWHYFYQMERNESIYYDFDIRDDYKIREDKTIIIPSKHYKACDARGDLAQVMYRPSQPPRRERKKKTPTCVSTPLSEVDALSVAHTLFDIKNLIENMGGRVEVTKRKKKKLLKIDVTLQGHRQTFYQQGDKRMRKKQLREFLQGL
jgi:hypothetical protein